MKHYIRTWFNVLIGEDLEVLTSNNVGHQDVVDWISTSVLWNFVFYHRFVAIIVRKYKL